MVNCVIFESLVLYRFMLTVGVDMRSFFHLNASSMERWEYFTELHFFFVIDGTNDVVPLEAQDPAVSGWFRMDERFESLQDSECRLCLGGPRGRGRPSLVLHFLHRLVGANCICRPIDAWWPFDVACCAPARLLLSVTSCRKASPIWYPLSSFFHSPTTTAFSAFVLLFSERKRDSTAELHWRAMVSVGQ